MESTTQKYLLEADSADPPPEVASRPPRTRKRSEMGLPESLGPFLLVDRLGSGGMGDVFKAVREDDTQREGPRQFFAVKRIRPEVGQDRELVKRLVDEARITALLDHPNIVKVFDFQQADRSYFIVMEYLDGADLASVLRALKRTKMSLRPAPVAEIGAQVARGLHYAHTFVDNSGHPSRIVHRDISPSNIMLLRDGRVKIVDFGVAKASELLRITETIPGTVRGKPAYFSPEQARGEALDGRSDIFSLGVTLWELLTGRRLFSGPTSVERIKALLGAQLEPPSRYRREIPPAIDRIVLRALQRERGRRYQTAAELADELESFLRSQEVRSDALPYVLRTIFRAARTGHIPASSDTLSTPVTRSLSGPVSASGNSRVESTEPGRRGAHARPSRGTAEITVAGGPTPRPRRTPTDPALARLTSRAHPDNRSASGMLLLKALAGDPAVAVTSPRSPALSLVSSSSSEVALPVGMPPSVQVLAEPTAAPPFRRFRRAALALAVAGLLVGLGGAHGWTWFHENSGSPSPSSVSSPAASVTSASTFASVVALSPATLSTDAASVDIEFRSEPVGAVVSSSAGILGTTPLVVKRVRAPSSERFQFKREGFETATLDVSCAKDTLLQVNLRPRPMTSPSRGAALGPASRTKPKRAARQGARR